MLMISFCSDKQSKLEKEIYEHFNKNNLLELESNLDDKLLNDMKQSLQFECTNTDQIHEFMYLLKQNSPLFAKKKNNEHLLLLGRV